MEVLEMAEVIFTVDSDGCAIDTMTYKHQLIMGPLAAEIFAVPEEEKEQFLENWSNINLFSKNRGVNRFTGLVLTLKSINYAGMNVDNLYRWAEEFDILSPDTLKPEIDKYGTDDLKAALEWTLAVNEGVANGKEHDDVFDGAKEGLQKISSLGKIYVVSTANREAITDEWTRYDLIEYVDGIYGQDSGKKEDTIGSFIAEGTDPHQIIMIGDSPGDLVAAEKNNAWFYPILVGAEKESWDELIETVADKFANGEFTQEDHDHYKQKFWDNLDK